MEGVEGIERDYISTPSTSFFSVRLFLSTHSTLFRLFHSLPLILKNYITEDISLALTFRFIDSDFKMAPRKRQNNRRTEDLVPDTTQTKLVRPSDPIHYITRLTNQAD